MSFVDSLRKQRRNPPAVWIQFTMAYQDGMSDVYVFFEGGADYTFYMPEIRRRWNGRGQVRPFDCDGKENVLALIPRVTRRLDHRWRALFFVDKDIDDILGLAILADPFLFQTECYSIENY
jgi:hypothetical protein